MRTIPLLVFALFLASTFVSAEQVEEVSGPAVMDSLQNVLWINEKLSASNDDAQLVVPKSLLILLIFESTELSGGKAGPFPQSLAAIVGDADEWRTTKADFKQRVAALSELAQGKVKVQSRWLDALMEERSELNRMLEQRLGKPGIMRDEKGNLVVMHGAGGPVVVVSANSPDEGPVFTAPFGKGGKWNTYQCICVPKSWSEADADAKQRSLPAGIAGGAELKGHLISISSALENSFATRILGGARRVWIGLNDRRIEAKSDGAGPWMWSNGEPVIYSNWRQNEPDNGGKSSNQGYEDVVILLGTSNPGDAGRWADVPDYWTETSKSSYAYLVEWESASDGPVAGAQQLKPLFPDNLPGVAGSDGAFGMRAAFEGGSCVTLQGALTAFKNAESRIVERQEQSIHFAGAAKTGFGAMFPPGPPFPGLRADQQNNDFCALFRGRIRIPERGVYTFGMHHDDGFALRIKGAKWRWASGTGTVDPADSTALVHPWAVDRGITHGAVELEAGEHEIECFVFQITGNVIFDLYAARGEFREDHETDAWRLVGHRSRGSIGWPGVKEWNATATLPDSLSRAAFDVAERELKKRGVSPGTAPELVDFTDPDNGDSLDLPGGAPFPQGVAGKDDEMFAFRAAAHLDIPADGLYVFGLNVRGMARMTLEGAHWKEVVLGRGKFIVDEDVIETENITVLSNEIRGTAELKAGSYKLEVITLHEKDRAAVEILAAPALCPLMPLRAKGARMLDDQDGLSLVK